MPTHCFLRNGIGAHSAIACIVAIVGAQDGMDAIVAEGHPKGILGKVWTAWVVAVDTVPGLVIDEYESIESQADSANHGWSSEQAAMKRIDCF